VEKLLAGSYLRFADAVDAAQRRDQWRGIIRDNVTAPKAKVGQLLPYQR
jgi:hypothetical protein